MRRKLTDVAENYFCKTEEVGKNFERAMIKEGVLRSTKLFFDTKSPYTSWEVHFSVLVKSDDGIIERYVPESEIDIDNGRPGEIFNTELAHWLDPETLGVLRERMIWDAGYTLTQSIDETDTMDTDYSWDMERRSWTPEEMQNLLELKDSEVDELRSRWERKQVYNKFGL